MPAPILTTKLYLPAPQPKLVSRPHLIERLNRGLAGHKLALIAAPAGFGKTTLLGEWIAACEHPAAWLSLDAGDSDPMRFLTYLIAALQTMMPDMGRDVLGMLQSPQPPTTNALLTLLINELAAVPNRFCLVLDDYHTVDSNIVDQIVIFLLEHVPPQWHLVIASREIPPLPLARLRARRQLTELVAADLRFTRGETAQFLNSIMGLGLSAQDIAALEVRTEGWIAGLQLAALSLQGNQDAHTFIQSFTGTHPFVLDYLLEEVLQKQTESTRMFLLRTSLLDRLCAPLCDALLDDAAISSQSILDDLERANLFIHALDIERHWYRYHPLFRDLLNQHLKQHLSPQEIAANHLCASEWHEIHGDEFEAFHHAIRAKDFERAARLAEMAWQGMDESFRAAMWLGWVKQLPEDVIRVRPVLCTQSALAFTDTGNVNASESRLRDAERCVAGTADEMVVVDQRQFHALPARIAFARAYNSLVTGPPSATVQYAEQALALIPADDPFLQAQIKAVLGSAYWSAGMLDAACSAMREWIGHAQQAGNFVFAIASAPGLADILVGQGRLMEAVQVYQQSLQLAAAHAEARSVSANHYLGLAMLSHEMGDDAAAAQYYQQGMALVPQSTLIDSTCRSYLVQARLKESEGDLEAALELLDQAKHSYVKSPIPDTRPVEALRTHILLKQGRLAQARVWVQAQALSVDDETDYLSEFEHLTLARVWIAEYQINPDKSFLSDALRLLERLLTAAAKAKRTGSVIEILIAQARAHQAQNNFQQALAPLKRALTLAEPEGYWRIFVDEGAAMAALLTGIKDEGVRTKTYVHRLLTALNQQEKLEVAASIPQPMIEPLSARERQVLGLIAEGLRNQEIADRLVLSLHTVKIHARNIYAKLGVNSRTQAVAKGKALGILPT